MIRTNEWFYQNFGLVNEIILETNESSLYNFRNNLYLGKTSVTTQLSHAFIIKNGYKWSHFPQVFLQNLKFDWKISKIHQICWLFGVRVRFPDPIFKNAAVIMKFLNVTNTSKVTIKWSTIGINSNKPFIEKWIVLFELPLFQFNIYGVSVSLSSTSL